MAPYPATTIANEFLRKAGSAGSTLTHMQVQKLVYLAHGWHLALTDGDPLIKERVLAWQYGPVIEELYYEFAGFKRDPIDRRFVDLMADKMGLDALFEPSISEDDAMARNVIDAVWEGYSHYSGSQLSSLTHQPDTPWDQAQKQHKSTIRDEVIRDHFRQLASA